MTTAEIGAKETTLEPLLLNTRSAAKLLGVTPRTFAGIVENNGLTAVSTGRTKLWKRLELERLLAIKESA